MQKIADFVAFFHTASDLFIFSIVIITLAMAIITLKIVTGKDFTWYDKNL